MLGRVIDGGAIRYIKIRKFDAATLDPAVALEYWGADDRRMDVLLGMGNLRRLSRHSLTVAAGIDPWMDEGSWPAQAPAQTAGNVGEYLAIARSEKVELAAVCSRGQGQMWLLAPHDSCERLDASLATAQAGDEAIRRAIAQLEASTTVASSRRPTLRAAARTDAADCAKLMAQCSSADLLPLAEWQEQAPRGSGESYAWSAARERRPTLRALDDARRAKRDIDWFITYNRELHARLLAASAGDPTWEWSMTDTQADRQTTGWPEADDDRGRRP